MVQIFETRSRDAKFVTLLQSYNDECVLQNRNQYHGNADSRVEGGVQIGGASGAEGMMISLGQTRTPRVLEKWYHSPVSAKRKIERKNDVLKFNKSFFHCSQLVFRRVELPCRIVVAVHRHDRMREAAAVIKLARSH
jgi:hypothetical protein